MMTFMALVKHDPYPSVLSSPYHPLTSSIACSSPKYLREIWNIRVLWPQLRNAGEMNSCGTARICGITVTPTLLAFPFLRPSNHDFT